MDTMFGSVYGGWFLFSILFGVVFSFTTNLLTYMSTFSYLNLGVEYRILFYLSFV